MIKISDAFLCFLVPYFANLGLITKDKLDTLLDICKSVKSDTNNILSTESHNRLNYAISNFDTNGDEDPNFQSSKNYMKCSTYLKGSAKIIAHSEFKRMKLAIKTDETNLLFDSSSHLTPHMVKLQEINSYSPGKHPCSVARTIALSDGIPPHVQLNDRTASSTETPSSIITNHNLHIAPFNTSTFINLEDPFNIETNQDNFNPPVPMDTTPVDSVDAFLIDANQDNFTHPVPIEQSHIANQDSYHVSTFNLVPPTTIRYTPIQAVVIITTQSDSIYRKFYDLPTSNNSTGYKIAKTTKNVIIQTMIALKYIPIQAPTMFKLVREFQKNNKLRYTGWFDTNTAGKKPSLKRSTLNAAIDSYKSRTEGGAALSKKP